METPSSSAPRRRRVWLRILILLAMLPLSLLLAEGGLRVWLALRGHPYDAEQAAITLRTLVSTMTRSIPDGAAQPAAGTGESHVLQPFIGADQETTLESAEGDLWAFSGRPEKPPFVVLIIGGSVAAQTWGQRCIPIADQLKADARLAGRSVVVLGQGRGALKQPQQVTLMAYLYALGWRPDVIVNIDGFNELALAWDNATRGIHPAYPSYQTWGLLAGERANRSEELRRAGLMAALAERGRVLGEEALEHGWQHSAILGEIALRRLRSVQQAWVQAQLSYTELLTPTGEHDTWQGPRFRFDEQSSFERLVQTWAESSVSLDGLARAHGALYLHVLQPTLHDEGSKPLTPEEIASGKGLPLWDEAIQRGYPLLRAAGAQLTQRGVRFVDLSLVFRELRERTYIDGCHFQGRGMALFGARIGEAILAALPAQLPPPARR